MNIRLNNEASEALKKLLSIKKNKVVRLKVMGRG